MFELVDKTMSAVNRLAAILTASLLGLATAAVFAQITIRFVLPPLGLTVSAPWTEESARFLMAWSVFLAVAVLCRRGGLIAITTLQTTLPAHLARWAILASTFFAAVFFAILFVIGWQWSVNAMRETATVLRIPMGLIYASMPVGAGIALINLALFVRDLFRSSDEVAVASAVAASVE